MNHQGTKPLESERLILRRFTYQDAESMYRNWACDPDVTRFLMWPPHASVEVTKKVLAEWHNHYVNPEYYVWAIVLKSLGEPVGCISVNSIDPATERVQIGYCLGKAWWHQGIMSEAFQAVIRFLFEEVGVNRIEARHDPENPHSGDVMRKCGLTYEGTLRKVMKSNRGVTDACIYGILREEYFSRKPA